MRYGKTVKKSKEFIRKLAVVGIIPNQILYSFISDKDSLIDELTAGSDEKTQRSRRIFSVLMEPSQVSSSIFVGDERVENLTKEFILIVRK